MNATEYFELANKKLESNLVSSVRTYEFLGEIQEMAAFLHTWHSAISIAPENKMYLHAAEQIEVSCLLTLSGLHRQAFSTLRLGLELIFGAVYFSVHRLNYLEWVNGVRDNVWATLNDVETGVLSPRFSKVLFPELKDEVCKQQKKSADLYRNLSEFVHGNFHTWETELPSLELDHKLIQEYEKFSSALSSLARFLFCLRYLNELGESQREQIAPFIEDSWMHIGAIRTKFGGVVES